MSISRFAIFKDPINERIYRSTQLSQNIRTTIILISIIIPSNLIFFFVDIKAYHLSHIFYHYLYVARIAFLIASMGIIYALKKTKNHKTFISIILIYFMLLAALMVLISTLRAPSFRFITAWNLVLIYIVYALVPLTLKLQLLPALFITISDFAIWFLFRIDYLSFPEVASIFFAYAFVNVIGIFTSYSIQTTRRRQFSMLHKEQSVNNDLQKALDEIKILRGIIPICSFCKKVRNDKGYYETVETYIEKRTDADFSHTICPQCLEKHYPEIVEKRRKKELNTST